MNKKEKNMKQETGKEKQTETRTHVVEQEGERGEQEKRNSI